MKSRSYLLTIIAGAIAGAVLNVEMLSLGGNGSVGEQYMDSVFSFNVFLEQKEYLISFNMILITLLFLCMTSNIMKNYQVPYVLLRLKNRFCWELGLTFEIVKRAFCFYFGFSFMIYMMSVFSCDAVLEPSDWKIWLLSLVALVYLGVLQGCLVNFFSCKMKPKIAVLFSYLLFMVITYMTMNGKSFFAKSKVAMYLNPVTAVSITEENQLGMILGIFLGYVIIGSICISALAYAYTRWENYVED